MQHDPNKYLRLFVRENKLYVLVLLAVSFVKWFYTAFMWAYGTRNWEYPLLLQSAISNFLATIPIIFLTVLVLNAAYRTNSLYKQGISFLLLALINPVLVFGIANLIKTFLSPDLIEPADMMTLKAWFFRNFFFFFMINVIYYLLKNQESYYQQRKKLVETQHRIRESLIKTFWYQVNPEFLFLTLEHAKTEVDGSKEKAKRIVVQLSEYYRKTLQIQNQFMPIDDEVETSKQYLDLIVETNPEIEVYEIRNISDGLSGMIPSFVLRFVIDAVIDGLNQVRAKESSLKFILHESPSQLSINIEISHSLSGKEQPEFRFDDITERMKEFYQEEVQIVQEITATKSNISFSILHPDYVE